MAFLYTPARLELITAVGPPDCPTIIILFFVIAMTSLFSCLRCHVFFVIRLVQVNCNKIIVVSQCFLLLLYILFLLNIIIFLHFSILQQRFLLFFVYYIHFSKKQVKKTQIWNFPIPVSLYPICFINISNHTLHYWVKSVRSK